MYSVCCVLVQCYVVVVGRKDQTVPQGVVGAKWYRYSCLTLKYYSSLVGHDGLPMHDLRGWGDWPCRWNWDSHMKDCPV